MTSYRSVPRSKLEADLSQLRAEIADAQALANSIRIEMQARLAEPLAVIGRLEKKADEIDAEIKRREQNDAIVPTVSDHALLRYIERVHEVDIEQIRGILLEKAEAAIKAGASAVRLDDCTLVIRGSSVVTVKVEQKREKPKKMTRAKRQQFEDYEHA
ncbi:hypothetical protein [Rhizobium alvei]|uniref:Uncharacterized protein n=1 Tax=Rhizobium alvei TaxID=1132659 RepID=A0ABT8YV92_9HYPH|nr:hypothetical protein [Rhizobium alvei]MDO6966955.1 hypothetical protein [Rhizobium alvei]